MAVQNHSCRRHFHSNFKTRCCIILTSRYRTIYRLHYDILESVRDWIGFISDIAIGATLAKYFTSSGLKNTDLLQDLAENAVEGFDYEDDDEKETGN